MAQSSSNGSGSSGTWGLGTRQQQLPPKSPWVAATSNQDPPTSNINDHQHGLSVWVGFTPGLRQTNKHQRTSSSIGLVPDAHTLPWLDEFMDLPPAKRGTMHRRSASDSLAFADAQAGGSALPHSEISDRDVFDCGSSSAASIPCREFEKLDEEQLLSMFADIEPFHKQQQQQHHQANEPSSAIDVRLIEPQVSENPSTPSDHNSICDTLIDEKPVITLPPGQVKMEQEVQSVYKSEPPQQHELEQQQQQSSQTGPSNSAGATAAADPNIDPKRVKRILANRQSAQRSRVRKLQYIADLEKSVSALQAEVSNLSPQVAYLDHQRLVLNVDNSALKQRIAALAQDKIFKDAHSEALKTEVQRLRQLATGFEAEHQQVRLANGISSSLSDVEGTRNQLQSENIEAINSSNCSSSNQQLLQPMSCLKSDSSNMAYHSDFMVHNS